MNGADFSLATAVRRNPDQMRFLFGKCSCLEFYLVPKASLTAFFKEGFLVSIPYFRRLGFGH